jgi:REP element-mobilizing transposase RayT
MAEGCDRSGFRLIHFSVQPNHLHLIVEAADAIALSRGIKGLEVRIARRLNALLRRKGRFFSDRYHARALRTPREVRAAIAYVLLNLRKHAHQSGRKLSSDRADPLSSAIYFDGWRHPIICILKREDPPPVTQAETWLLREGWKRHGLIAASEIPACA